MNSILWCYTYNFPFGCWLLHDKILAIARKKFLCPTQGWAEPTHLARTPIAFYRVMLRAAMRLHVVCPSVTFRYRDQICWNSSKIISRPNSLRSMRFLILSWAIWCNGNTPKLGWNRGGIRSTKTCKINETVQDRTKVTITD